MRNFLKKTAALLMAMLVLNLATVSAFATYMEHEGLEVSVLMDKEVYEQGEPITATITVKYTNTEAVTITNLEQLIPEGYVLSEGSEVNTSEVILEAGKSVTLNVTYGESLEEIEEDPAESFFDTLIFGESFGIPNILIALIVIVALFIFFKLT